MGFRTVHVQSVTGGKPQAGAGVADSSRLARDDRQLRDYNILKRTHGFKAYDQVNHSKAEYVRGIAHTNTVESYFAIMKRGLVGTFHHVAPKHLQRYSNEFSFRYNTRTALGFSDTDRANLALKGIGGKRLTYRRTDGDAVPRLRVSLRC